jgi:hypothetical protein
MAVTPRGLDGFLAKSAICGIISGEKVGCAATYRLEHRLISSMRGFATLSEAATQPGRIGIERI